MPLLPYQEKWVRDDAKLKIVVKARQTGFSFAAALRAVLQCLERKTTWIFLSKGERQSRLLMEKVQAHVEAIGLAAQLIEKDFMEGTSVKQLEVRFPNGSVIYGLPANPETARGYTGHVTLDEFAFHADAAKIYSALFPTITRGFGIEVISTPNGTSGKFYELAKKAGLVAGAAPDPDSKWSPHRVDIYEAVRQGLKTDLDLLRAGVDSEDDWLQEYGCAFVSTAENFFPPELLARAVSPEAAAAVPLETLREEPGEFFLGVDIGRVHDRTVFWLDRVREIAPALPSAARPRRQAVARRVETLAKAPFERQLAIARQYLTLKRRDGGVLIRRCSIDATGLGAMLAEMLATEFGPRVEPVTFTAQVKEDLAYRTKRLLESDQALLPDTREIHRAFSAVKKTVTAAGNIRFDAERTEAGHADEFWAKALADFAAEGASLSSEHRIVTPSLASGLAEMRYPASRAAGGF